LKVLSLLICSNYDGLEQKEKASKFRQIPSAFGSLVQSIIKGYLGQNFLIYSVGMDDQALYA
jgi:hypothetical protein